MKMSYASGGVLPYSLPALLLLWSLCGLEAAPSIGPIADQSVSYSVPAISVPIQVTDTTTLSTLRLYGGSSNPSLVPTNNLVFSGTDTSRFLTIVPVGGITGTSTISVLVVNTNNQSTNVWFLFSATNALPTISGIPDTRVAPNHSTAPLPFSVGDLETPASNLVVNATSSDPSVVANTNIVLGGSGSNRTVTVTPARNLFSGSSVISLVVMDEKGGRTTNSFQVSVTAFSDIGLALPGFTTQAGAAWADYDNDGWLDFVVAGNDGNGAFSPAIGLYRNLGGTNFMQITNSLPGIQQGNLAWGDYNNDNRLDLLLLSPLFGGPQVHRNNGDSTFTKIFEGAFTYEGTVDWGDFDNDGRLDFAAGGWNSSVMFTTLYRNTGGSFAVAPSALDGTLDGRVAWADFDKDGYPDLLTLGYRSFASYYCTVWRNDTTGQLVPAQTLAPGFFTGEWGDFDNDGYLDLLYSRQDTWGSNQLSVIYRNNRDGSFSDTGIRLPGIYYGTLAWGDFDNDGRLDILMCGFSPSENTNVTRIYRNNGNSTFTDIQAGLPAISNGRAAWGDFDNDGRLDILITGQSEAGLITRIYHNDMPRTNTPPTAPAGLAASVTTNFVRLSWQAATDPDQTNSLSYNLRVGTTPGGYDVVSPSADLVSGWRRLPHRGNADLDLSWPLRNLASGTYYWSVQAVDNAYAGSPFASEATFVITQPPMISGIASVSFHYNANSGPVPFTIGDAETPADDLVLTAQSFNTNLVPAGNVVFGGSGSNRTVTVTPAPNQVGSTSVSVRLADAEGYTTNSTFNVNVLNFTPVISSLANQLIPVGGSTGPVPITIGDYETAASDLVMSAECSNTNLVPLQNIVFGGSGSNRTVTVTLDPTQHGSAAITIYDSDPLGSRGVTGFTLTAQELAPLTNFIAAAYGTTAWCDYDNDGRLDLLVTGESGTGVVARIERNLGNGNFVETDAGLPGVRDGSAAWGDYDNDGKADLLLAGTTDGGLNGALARVYHNNGDGTFTDISAGLPGVVNASVAWGDFDRDGRLDILISGVSTSGALCRIYRNNGNGTFTDINAGFPGLDYGSVAWGDFDNDGNPDVLLTGNFGGTAVTRVFRNMGGGYFTVMNVTLPGVMRGGAVWGDYDNDGWPDILLCGLSGSAGIAQIYHNVGGTNFTATTTLPGVSDGGVAWADYDNDGRLDALVWCGTGPADITHVYRNLGGGAFADIDAGLPGLTTGGAAFGDYDDDGRLDLALAGNGSTTLAHNVTPLLNPPPVAPQTVSAVVSNNTVTFTWTAATDGETPSPGLSYNLRVGTSPGAEDVLSPAARNDGWRRLVGAGNAGQRTNLTLTDLPISGTYYWSVQAVDTTYAGSPFSAEASFTATFPPMARTLAATGISNCVATLNGYVSAKGSGTAAWFEYGPSLSLGSRLDLAPVAPDALILPETAVITNLTVEVTNYFRLVASNQAGISYGYTFGFFSGNPPLFLAMPATNISSRGAKLRAQVNPNRSATTAWFEYGTTTNYGLTSISSSLAASTNYSTVQQTVTALSFGTIYHYRVVASNEFGTAWGPDTVFATTAEPAISSVTVSSISNTTAQVSAFVSPQGLTTTVYFEYGASTNYGNFTPFLSVGQAPPAGSLVSFNLTNLVPGASNYFRVVALNSSGTTVSNGPAFRTLFPFGKMATPNISSFLYSALAWGDCDNDGRVDLAVSGSLSFSSPPIFKLYRNTAGQGFYEQPTSIIGTRYGSIAWGDFNSDGRLDLLITGATNASTQFVPITRVYRNDGNGVFTDINAGLPGVAYGAAAWGDFNNDGRPDIFLTGSTNYNTSYQPISRIYLNNGNGTFSLATNSFPGFQNSAVALGDFNGDGRLDILVSGLTNAYASYSPVTLLYRNNGGNSFTSVPANLVGVRDGSLAWGDYDQDGRPDILLSGNTNASVYAYNVFPVSKVYHNNGDGTFTDTAAGLAPVHHSSAVWGDYDNDGRLDILLTGEGRYSVPQTNFAGIYRNTGGAFELVSNPLPGCSYGGGAWGDYDNDGRLDFMLAGQTNSSYASVCALYKNFLPPTNTAPAAPASPATLVSGNAATLLWSAGADAQTASAGLTYNLRIGTVPGGEDILTPMANTNAGRKLPAAGNVGEDKLWTFVPSAPGTYYWAVQSVDNGFAASAFTAEQTFSIFGKPALAFTNVVAVSPATGVAAGLVDANGYDTAVWAEWGTTTNLGVASASQTFPGGSLRLPLSAPLTNLVPLTVYYCRLVASNAAGVSFSTNRTFAQAGEPILLSQSFTNVTAATALLQAAVNPALSATTVQFDWGASTNYGNRTPATAIGSGSNAVAVAANLTGLAPDATIFFRAVASNALGQTFGPDASFQTAPAPSFAAVMFNTNGFALRAVGAAGLVYDVQTSTNLVDWVSLGTAPADTNGVIQFVDPAATNFTQRFYRLQSP